MSRSISKLFSHASVALVAPAAIAFFAPACSSDEPVAATPAEDGGNDTGGAMGSTGGAKNTGGGNATGGRQGATGGNAGAGGSTGGSGGTGGSTGGTPGNGGCCIGGSGGTDGGNGGTPTTGVAPATGGTPATGGAGGTEGGAPDACAPLSLTPPTVVAAIQAPAGATVVQHFHATGTQDYTCKGTALPDAGTSYSWGSSIPDAKLLQGTCQVGTHYAGPTWAFTADGSTVVAARVAGETHAGTIPWLLLKAVSNTGTGVMSNVTFIQRVDTTGGVSPTDPCDAGHVNEARKVDYTAEYYFFEGGVGDAGP